MEAAIPSYPTSLYTVDYPLQWPNDVYWTPSIGDPAALADFQPPSIVPAKKRASKKSGRRGERRGTKKPPESYIECIRMAIEAHPLQEATLAEIYAFLRDFHPFFRDPAYTGWKNSVRHNLSLMPCFEKLDKRNGRKRGKGHPWRYNAAKTAASSSVDGAKSADAVNAERKRAKEQPAVEMTAFDQHVETATSSSSGSNSFGSEAEGPLQVDQTPFIPATAFYTPPVSHGYAQCGWPSAELYGQPTYPSLFVLDEAAGGVKVEATSSEQPVEMTHFPSAVDPSFSSVTPASSTFEHSVPVDPTAFYQQYAYYDAAFEFPQNTWAVPVSSAVPLMATSEVDGNFFSLHPDTPNFAHCGFPSLY